VHYIATALDLACDFIFRATSDMRVLFQEALASSKKPQTATRDEHFARVTDSILQWEGGHIQELIPDDDSGAPILCSNCFHDEGLRLSSAAIGEKDMSKCLNCGSQDGRKLNRKSVAILAQQFFVWGTIQRLDYGASPLVQFNKRQSTSIKVAPWLEPDLQLIGKTLEIGFFDYGPRLWMVGEVEPLKALQEPNTRAEVISRILTQYPGRILGTDEYFYRMRKAQLIQTISGNMILLPAKNWGRVDLTEPNFPFFTDLRTWKYAYTNVGLLLRMKSTSQHLPQKED
jgi:hypothetical protein